MKKSIFLLASFFLLFSFLLFLNTKEKQSDFKIENHKKDMEKFEKKNVYVTGWLRVEGTNIDMPVLLPTYEEDQLTDKDQYAWTNAKIDKNSNHLSILSHNIRNVSSYPKVGDKSMRQFEQLMSFIYIDFIKKNQFIEYTDYNQKSNLYRIYAVLLEKTDQYELSKKANYTKKEQEKYIDFVKKNSVYDLKTDVDADDSLISLITCTRFYKDTSYSFQVEARKMRTKEKTTRKKVTATKKYTKIQKQLKEGKKDEKSV